MFFFLCLYPQFISKKGLICYYSYSKFYNETLFKKISNQTLELLDQVMCAYQSGKV